MRTSGSNGLDMRAPKPKLRPFNDNGNNRTGVAFMQGTAQIEQEVSGLTVGKEYVLSLDFNAQLLRGRDSWRRVGSGPGTSRRVSGPPVHGRSGDASRGQ